MTLCISGVSIPRETRTYARRGFAFQCHNAAAKTPRPDGSPFRKRGRRSVGTEESNHHNISRRSLRTSWSIGLKKLASEAVRICEGRGYSVAAAVAAAKLKGDLE